ncbi:MAG: PLP-dependent transferase [Verrucomicrobiota bacterium]
MACVETRMTRDFLKDPAWRPEELGQPIPDSPHAVSVCLPTWADVVGYEEGEARVLDVMKAGYPRFFRPLAVRRWEAELAQRDGEDGCLIFPNEQAAERCRSFIEERHDGWKVRVTEAGAGALGVVFPEQVASTAAKYWRFCGEGVSSRRAAAFLAGTAAEDGEAALRTVRERVAAHNGQAPQDVFLFPSGMAGVAALHRALVRLSPGCRSAQLDFPYVDVLKVQENFGSGAWFRTGVDEGPMGELGQLLGSEQLAGVFCEIASNPLLRTPDLSRLALAAGKGNAPLIVDDTVATSIDVEAARFADVITTSLTKAFNGRGDVLAGAVTLCRGSTFYDRLKPLLREEADCDLWAGDAILLAEQSQDFRERVETSGRTAEQLVEWLRRRPGVKAVHYPSDSDAAYGLVKRESGSFGTLFSMELENPEQAVPRFHDNLRLSKGPSLGNRFSLACAYTLLAHYEELAWAEGCGVSRWLVRVSVGMESFEDLKSRFEEALES